MHISKICSKATYHKCMRELNERKYIKYIPSFNPFKGSMVVLINFSEEPKPTQKKASNNSKNEQVLNKRETSTETGTEQALVSSINNINKTNIPNEGEPSSNFKMHVAFSNYENNLEKKPQRDFFVTSSEIEKPPIGEIKTYFNQQNFPEIEAQKFFNYFSSNGWLVGGKTPMIDWKASAQNWMLNANKFNMPENKTGRAKHLNTKTDKNYSEPL